LKFEKDLNKMRKELLFSRQEVLLGWPINTTTEASINLKNVDIYWIKNEHCLIYDKCTTTNTALETNIILT
jgi:hypothetical protein